MVITGKTSIYPTQRPNRAESGNRVQKIEIKLSIDNSRKHKKTKWRAKEKEKEKESAKNGTLNKEQKTG